jgi:hypothetical protein
MPPRFFVSVADKGLSDFLSPLESALVRHLVSVVDKGVRLTVRLSFG